MGRPTLSCTRSITTPIASLTIFFPGSVVAWSSSFVLHTVRFETPDRICGNLAARAGSEIRLTAVRWKVGGRAKSDQSVIPKSPQSASTHPAGALANRELTSTQSLSALAADSLTAISVFSPSSPSRWTRICQTSGILAHSSSDPTHSPINHASRRFRIRCLYVSSGSTMMEISVAYSAIP